MSNTLLPPNASQTERDLEAVTARVSNVPILTREAWNPDTCPVELLPWLAWAFSVDEWQNDWTEAEKRGVIKGSLKVHRHKGTLGALRRAIEPLGYIIRIIEWYEEVPPAIPYTFKLEIAVTDKGVNETIYEQLTTLIETYKNVRSHMLALTVKAEVKGSLYLAATMMSGVSTTVYPYAAEEMESINELFYGAFEQTIDTVAVYPAA